MGIDLSIGMRVVPYLVKDNDKYFLVTNRLDFCRDYELFEEIGQVQCLPITFDVQWYGDEGVEKLTTDPYGNPLTFVFSQDLAKIEIKESYHPWNKAILRFVKELPEDIKILLYWS